MYVESNVNPTTHTSVARVTIVDAHDDWVESDSRRQESYFKVRLYTPVRGSNIDMHIYSDEASTIRVANDGSPHANATNDIRRGIFALPFQLPQQQSSACLARSNESVAWQCTPGTIQLNILPAPMGDANATMGTIGPLPSSGGRLYGDQVPDIPLVRIQAVGDITTTDSLAYHFRTTYNRIVLLREDDFTQPKDRQAQSTGKQPGVLPGDSIWQCTFNETVIEGYIYVSKPTRTYMTDMVNVTATIRLPTIPYAVRLVEKRIPNGKAPYCEKTMIESDGSLARSSERIMLYLSDPEAEAAASTSKVTEREKAQDWQREETSNYCRCQWLVQ
jgi:hypothetical protein